MELWLRRRKATHLEYDERIVVGNQDDWKRLVDDPSLISSVLWPNAALYRPEILHMNRHHAHEVGYANDPVRNASYLDGCRRLAGRLNEKLAGRSCLVYAPLRGALPIWRGIRRFITGFEYVTHYPVTSSFVFYPAHFGITGKRGRPASGRFNNRFELERLEPFLGNFDRLVYVDEIVSGGMLWGHIKDMFRLGIDRAIPIVAVGLADGFGVKSAPVREKIAGALESGRLHDFVWEGCSSLVTEDQKFLLGVHYSDYDLGPHAVPLLDEGLEFFEEKRVFDAEVFGHASDPPLTIRRGDPTT